MENLPEILQTFADFTDGFRFLMLTHRGKEGGKVNKPDRVAKKKLSRNPEEFATVLAEFLALQAASDIPLRIYSCVNRRNPDKAIREFKRRQLDADYYDSESRYSFYTDITNRWISCVMEPASREETKFLLDIDPEDDEMAIRKQLTALNVRIFLDYPTKNGRHLVTQPFNPALLPIAERLSGNRVFPVASISSSILAIMKLLATTMTKLVKHKMNVTDLDHSSTGFYASLIILTISSFNTFAIYEKLKAGRET